MRGPVLAILIGLLLIAIVLSACGIPKNTIILPTEMINESLNVSTHSYVNETGENLSITELADNDYPIEPPTIVTDKETYKLGEVVHFNLTNNLHQTIYYGGCGKFSPTIIGFEKKENGQWKRYIDPNTFFTCTADWDKPPDGLEYNQTLSKMWIPKTTGIHRLRFDFMNEQFKLYNLRSNYTMEQLSSEFNHIYSRPLAVNKHKTEQEKNTFNETFIEDFIFEGEEKTFTLNNKEYIINNVEVSGDYTYFLLLFSVSLTINNQHFEKLVNGEIVQLMDGSFLGIIVVTEDMGGEEGTKDLARIFLGMDISSFHPYHDDERLCEADSDCVKIPYGCCECSIHTPDNTINKKYADEIIKKTQNFCNDDFQKEIQKGICSGRTKDHWTCDAIPKCINDKCQLVAE